MKPQPRLTTTPFVAPDSGGQLPEDSQEPRNGTVMKTFLTSQQIKSYLAITASDYQVYGTGSSRDDRVSIELS